MITTVVGSYPSKAQEPQKITDKLKNIFGAYDPYKIAIKNAVYAQLNAGIDIISDGQVRGDMIEIFAKDLPGMVIEDNTCKIKNQIRPAPKTISGNDLKYANKLLNNFIKESNLSPEEKAKKGVKGIITGPSTMVFSSRLDGFYSMKQKDKAIIDMANALKQEAKTLEESGAKYIQLDEPFLSTGMVNLNTAKKAINIISKDIKIPVAMHVCGDISNVLDQLLKFNVDILDLEFAGIENNLNILKNQKSLHNKKIGFGSVDTKKDSAESIDEIKKLIDKGIKILGSENMIIDPDCGMKTLNPNIAQLKLKNMVESTKIF
jgi:5-methyltetrahydropteroyltriglutamate--homocysteine methyltransferase